MNLFKFFWVFNQFYFTYAQRPVVQLKFGKVLGEAIELNNRTINQFLGLPFAKPPVKTLRFKKPKPFQGTWRTPYNATQWPNVCPQLYRQFSQSDALGEPNEDCLYLNIWTPQPLNGSKTENLKSVLVYIHNGGFISGSSSEKDLIGLELAARADVVLVTLSYRVGPLGFLYADDEEAPGNAGLWDQLLALQWVKDHIRSFGGNPDQITISGQSAGAMSVVLHILSPYGSGLFNKAIVMSGIPVNQFPSTSKSYALTKASRLATLVGCRKSSQIRSFTRDELKCMRKINYTLLLQAQLNPIVTEEYGYNSLWPFRPLYGDKFAPVSPIEAMRSDNVKTNLQILLGTVTNDAAALPDLYSKSPNSTGLSKDAQYLAVLSLYYNDGSTEAQETMATIAFSCPTAFFGEHTYLTNDVFEYNFAYPSRFTIFCTNNTYRPCHGDEVNILFGTKLTDENDKAASRAWIEFIANFVKGVEMPVPKFSQKDGRFVAPYYKFNGPNDYEIKEGYHRHDCIVFNAGIDAGKLDLSYGK